MLWLDGGREEASLAFTNAERRRPINWRELLGIVRVCEVGGERLKSKTVLVETDNMAAKGASSKLSSKSADMQELVRRLMRLSERHEFTLRVTQQPPLKHLLPLVGSVRRRRTTFRTRRAWTRFRPISGNCSCSNTRLTEAVRGGWRRGTWR